MVLHSKHKGLQPNDFYAKMTSYEQLILPGKFVEDYGNDLSNFVFLHVPGGNHWPVEVFKGDCDVGFFEGWKNFAENYSIERDSLLIFTYHEISHPTGAWRFQVRIFKPNASEMDYFSTTGQNLTSNLEITEEKTMNLEITEKETMDIEGSTKKETTDLEGSSEIRRVSAGKLPKQKAMDFQNHCQNPTFMAEIKRRNTISNTGPVISRAHCKEHYKENEGNKKIILRIHKKIWRIQLRSAKSDKLLKALVFGWREFVLDNKVQEGDVCVFEMTDSSLKTYDVHIFRVSDQQKQKPSMNDDIPILISSSDEEDTDLKNKAKAFLGESPGFIKCMTKNSVYSSPPVSTVPFIHSKRYMKVDDNADLNAIVIKGKGGKTWTVKYRLDGSYPKLGVGWSRFRSDNSLEIGDVCAFKLINTSHKVYEVAIFRVNAK